MTDFETITVDQHRAVATITLRRPEAGNALNSPMRRELTAVFGSIADTARAVLLTGAGPRFCAGQDLGGAANFKALDLESALLDETLPLVQQIAKCPRPVICAVNGLAAGAGANLALACDIVIAAHSASFLQANVLAGMIPDTGGTYFLPRRVGVARAMALSLTGEAVSAEQAADWGLIWKAVADDDLMEEANALADRLAKGPADAHASIKQAIGVSLQNSLEDQVALEARLQGELSKSRDFAEGVSAMMDGRPAEFDAASAQSEVQIKTTAKRKDSFSALD